MLTRLLRVFMLEACTKIHSGDFGGYPQSTGDGQMSAWPQCHKVHVGENDKVL